MPDHQHPHQELPPASEPITRKSVTTPVFLPPLGYKRCTACGRKQPIKGGSQKNGRFTCATCHVGN